MSGYLLARKIQLIRYLNERKLFIKGVLILGIGVAFLRIGLQELAGLPERKNQEEANQNENKRNCLLHPIILTIQRINIPVHIQIYNFFPDLKIGTFEHASPYIRLSAKGSNIREISTNMESGIE